MYVHVILNARVLVVIYVATLARYIHFSRDRELSLIKHHGPIPHKHRMVYANATVVYLPFAIPFSIGRN